MRFIEIRLSPEAKHVLKWVHTWLGIAAAGAPLAYDHLDVLQGLVSERGMHYVSAVLVLLMIFNTMRAKDGAKKK